MARRATSLETLLIFVCLFSFFFFSPFFAFNKKHVFPSKEGHFCLFLSVSLCFFLAFFASPFFTFSFSVSLSLSLVLSFFLLVFFAFFWFLVFVSFFFFLVCICFMQRTTSKYSITKLISIYHFSFLWFSVLFSLSNIFFLSLSFLDFTL